MTGFCILVRPWCDSAGLIGFMRVRPQRDDKAALQQSSYAALMARGHGHIVALQGRGVLTLPAELRRRHHLDEPGAQVSIVETDDGRIELIPLAAVPASQKWFWTE